MFLDVLHAIRISLKGAQLMFSEWGDGWTRTECPVTAVQ